jgi:hypothetical protein
METITIISTLVSAIGPITTLIGKVSQYRGDRKKRLSEAKDALLEANNRDTGLFTRF